jgi:hypothetical protein
VLLFAISLVLTGPVRKKEEWNAVAAVLKQDVRPGDAIIVCPKYPAFRHAITSPLDAPVVATMGDRLVLMEESIGSGQAWMTSYFRAFVEPPMRLVMNQPATLPVRTAMMPAFGRAWLVESECGEDQHRAIQRWLGRSGWTLALASPATSQRAAIRVWQSDGIQPMTRSVLVIHD